MKFKGSIRVPIRSTPTGVRWTFIRGIIHMNRNHFSGIISELEIGSLTYYSLSGSPREEEYLKTRLTTTSLECRVSRTRFI